MQILFELVGGSRDGDIDDTDTDYPPEWNHASINYRLTNQGQVGARFLTGVEFAIQQLEGRKQEAIIKDKSIRAEIYEIIERTESSECIRIRCKFVGYAE